MMRDIGEDHFRLDVPARRCDRFLGRKRKKTHIRYSRLIERICTFRGHYITNQCTIPQIYRTFALFDFTKGIQKGYSNLMIPKPARKFRGWKMLEAFPPWVFVTRVDWVMGYHHSGFAIIHICVPPMIITKNKQTQEQTWDLFHQF